MPIYRDNGAIGALLDEYERALNDFCRCIAPISEADVLRKVEDKDFPTIQKILAHVLRAGYRYAINIRRHHGGSDLVTDYAYFTQTEDYVSALKEMFAFTESVFQAYPGMELEEKDLEKQMLVSWGQRYTVEQLMEHAIVHILRHRRQIERRLIELGGY